MNLFTRFARPPRASGREPALVHPEAWNKLVDYCIQLEDVIRKIQPRSSPDVLVNTGSGGSIISLARRGKSSPSGACPFGRLKTWYVDAVLTTGIAGGPVSAGAYIFDVADYALDLGTPGTFYAWLETAVTANEDAGMLLPGFSSATQTTLEIGGAYPTQDIPTIASAGAGTSIVPLGVVVIAAGAAVFSPAGCGAVTLFHCPGSLTYSRG